MLWLFVGPTRVYLLHFFCSGIQFYILLSVDRCFISFSYLGLYVLGDDSLISNGYFMQIKYLCVLIHIFTKGKVGATLNWLFFLPCVCYAFVCVCLLVTWNLNFMVTWCIN